VQAVQGRIIEILC